jgi:cysteine synthase
MNQTGEKMPGIYENLVELIGNTPLVKLAKFSQDSYGKIVAKLESYNPGSSVKDRIGLSMIEAAEKSGQLKPGATIVEPTSGNTGIGLALVAAIKGYHVVLTMPESMSVERRKLLRALGAEIVLTDAQEGMIGAISKAQKLVETIENAFMPQQFSNPANSEIHYNTTGPEIWKDTEGEIDVFVSGVGTGGTITGAGMFLKERNPEIQIVAVEPTESAILSGEEMGPHMIQGIGAGFVPEILDIKIIDEIIKIESVQAIETAKELAKKEGLLVGISSGACAAAAKIIANRQENKGKRIVAILPDTGERYVSTLLFYQD